MRHILLSLLFCSIALSSPIRNAPERIEPLPTPDVSGKWINTRDYCTIRQLGRTLRLDGPGRWIGTGELRKDGSMLVYWFDGDVAGIGVYHYSEQRYVGKWNTVDAVKLNDDGELTGRGIYDDFVRPAKEE